MVTFLGSIPVTVALLTVLVADCVSEEPGLATFAAIPEGVFETELADTGEVVAGGGVGRVDVSVTGAGRTVAIQLLNANYKIFSLCDVSDQTQRFLKKNYVLHFKHRYKTMKT